MDNKGMDLHAPNRNGNVPLLEMIGITKVFPGVKALEGVSFDLNRGEVHVLLGENGAGKSTLMKVLSGAHLPDAGKIYINGKEVHIGNPKKAEELGVSIIYQEFNLVPYLSVAENIFLGREPIKGKGVKIIDWNKVYGEAQLLLEMLGSRISPRTVIRDLSVAEQQMVEIAKALSVDSQIIVMDEPTATLNSQEIDRLFNIIEQIRQKRKGIIYISHRLEEVFKIGDRITVLRDGHCIGTVLAKETKTDMLIQMMVGHQLDGLFPWEKREIKEEVLSIEGLNCEGAFYDINLVLRQGEILGLAGLVGSGRTELARAIFGSHPVDSGTIRVRGDEVMVKSPRNAVDQGIGFLPADRKTEGLIACLPIFQNMTIASLSRFVRNGIIRLKEEYRVAVEYKEKLEIKVPTLNRKVIYLSGGNQQKVMLTKWLCSQSRIILFDEPTRGVDVGAKFEIHRLMIELVKQGKAIIMISSELPEILGMSDRIMVMRQGRIVAELSREAATQAKILQHMMLSNPGSLPSTGGANNGRR